MVAMSFHNPAKYLTLAIDKYLTLCYYMSVASGYHKVSTTKGTHQ